MKIDINHNEKEYSLKKSEKYKLSFILAILLIFALIILFFTVIIVIKIGELNILTFFGSLLLIGFALLILVYSRKYYLDIKNSIVNIYTGPVIEKNETGYESPLFIIKIGEAFHHVRPGQYYKLKIGDQVTLRKAPISKKVIGIEINKKNGA